MASLTNPLTKFQLSRQRKLRKPVFNFSHRSKDIQKIGVVSLPEAWERENCRSLKDDINASDAIRFCGVNKDGGIIMASMTRRPDRRAEVSLYVRLTTGEQYQLPSLPDSSVYNTDGHSFTAAGLTFEVLEPLRRWRVIFNGYLRKGISSRCTADDCNVVAARFSFIWHPSFSYLAFPDDFSDAFLLRLMSKSGLAVPWDIFAEEWHEQFGELNGTIDIDGQESCQLYVRGVKSRSHGVFDCSKVTQKFSVQGILHNGLAFHLFFENPSVPSISSQDMVYGYICLPCNTMIQYLRDCNLNASIIERSTNQLDITFTAGDSKYKLHVESSGSGFNAYGGEMWNCESTVRHVILTLNGKPGEGIMEFVGPNAELRSSPPRKSLPILMEPDIPDCTKLVVNFRDPQCASNKQVGGKASSLALMTLMLLEYDLVSPRQHFVLCPLQFQVPLGVCVTKFAFTQHLSQNPELLNAIDHLQTVAWTKADEELKQECARVEDLFRETKLSKQLSEAIKESLTTITSENYEEMKFAVRSSAVGEDGEDLSAAGQNETYLGVLGLTEISQSLIKCWASQFSFRSTMYKRLNGQLINGGMGVVIQRMVPASVAGVLFSRDPISGSLSRMVISSNYGLGESVVSGGVDPDTIILKRSFIDVLSVHSKQMGTKKTAIQMTDGAGTVECELDKSTSDIWSLSDDNALRLGEVALLLERSCGNARDIEWAFVDDQLFLLQSRPVTTENVMTEFEVLHEFDSPLRTDHERYTTANIGEVMPGALVPLTVTSIVRGQTILFQYLVGWKVKSHRYDPTVHEGLASNCGHQFFDRVQQKSYSLEKTKGAMSKSMEIGFFGRVLDDQDVVDMALDRYRNPPRKAKFTLLKFATKGMISGKKLATATHERYRNFYIQSTNELTAKNAYSKAGDQLMGILNVKPLSCIKIVWVILLIYWVTLPHLLLTMASSTWNLLVLNILAGGNNADEEFTLTNYSDFAILIGCSNGAESGDVPFSLRELAKSIALEVNPQEFSKQSPEQALQWLRESGGDSCIKFQDFLKRHGHRGLKEFDVFSISWGMNNIDLVKVLQEMIKTPAILSDTSSANEVDPVALIKTPLSPLKKKMLSYIMKKCRNGVCQRELSKSMLIKFYDSYRIAYRHLADLMVKEGFLPDPNLLFFLTFEEIGILLETRSAKLLRRARQRYKLNPYMDGLRYSEMVDGFPKPDDGQVPLQLQSLDGSVMVKGYPVSQGIVQGLARVVDSFSEVNTVQAGEILITYSTDIGWSPYFPMLTGIVTEIGGLVSHGAVVAREFGLPCIVGAANATRMFKSGDQVILNATEGTLRKITTKTSDSL